MTVNVSSIGLKGLEGYRVQVEVQISQGTESMVIVGLPDVSVKESKERVLSAIRTLGYDMTFQKVVVNLSPLRIGACHLSGNLVSHYVSQLLKLPGVIHRHSSSNR